jgi:hypothetical protein
MNPFSGSTDVVHTFDLDPQVRAYFSATAARLKEEIWLRVETRWVAEGAPLEVTLFREEEDGLHEEVLKLSGTIASDLWEKSWRIDLPKSRLDELPGPIFLTFQAAIKGVARPAHSQTLLVHRTRFSS